MDSVGELTETAFESLKNNSNSKRGGARPGAGRPKGKPNQATIDRMAVKKAFQERVAAHADSLFNAQFRLAVGEAFVYHVYYTGSGKNRKKHTEIVRNPELIRELIDEHGDNLGFGTKDSNDQDHYYFVSTTAANNQALEALLNRSFGKADENIDITTGGNALPEATRLPSDVVEGFTEFMMAKTKGTGANNAK